MQRQNYICKQVPSHHFQPFVFSEKTNVNNIKCLKFVKREKERGKEWAYRFRHEDNICKTAIKQWDRRQRYEEIRMQTKTVNKKKQNYLSTIKPSNRIQTLNPFLGHITTASPAFNKLKIYKPEPSKSKSLN